MSTPPTTLRASVIMGLYLLPSHKSNRTKRTAQSKEKITAARMTSSMAMAMPLNTVAVLSAFAYRAESCAHTDSGIPALQFGSNQADHGLRSDDPTADSATLEFVFKQYHGLGDGSGIATLESQTLLRTSVCAGSTAVAMITPKRDDYCFVAGGGDGLIRAVSGTQSAATTRGAVDNRANCGQKVATRNDTL